MVSKHRVVDHIVDELAAGGVDYVFGVDGANIEDLFDAMNSGGGVTGILAKHEFSAATMADGYSRASSGMGVVAATSGGGSLNLVAGLGESFASRVPVLALVGQPPTALDGLGSFQDTSSAGGSLDALALFSAVSVYCRRVVEPNDIVTALAEAVAAAKAGGPAVLLLPKDVQQSMIDRVDAGRSASASPRVGDLTPIVEELRCALGPVTIIAGEQVARDDARASLEGLRAALRAWVATVPDAKDVSGTPGLGASSALGVTGVMGHPLVERAVSDSAVCLVVGTRLSVTARAGLDAALGRVRVLSIGSAEPYVPSVHVHSEDLNASLAELTRALTGHGRPRGLQVLDVLEALPLNELQPPEHDGPGVSYRDAMTALDEALPDGADVVVDAGNSGAAAIHHLPVRRSGRFVVALGMGGMGYSFGAGIGMCFARAMGARAKGNGQRRRTVVVAGDGSFFMHGMELHTAIEYGLPLTVVLLNNNAHAMCVTREQLFYGGQYSYNRFRPSRLGAGLAAMFPGLPSVDVTDVAALPGALRAALAHDGPAVVSIECSADEIPPFAPFLQVPQHHSIDKELKPDVAARA
jgi:acetolactate synthase I/II/III large subunit